MIPFGEWTPDQPNHGTDAVVQAVNVIAAPGGYRTMPRPAVVSTVAMTEDCYGAFVGTYISSGAALRTLFTGGASKLFQMQAGVFTDVSVAGGYGLNVSVPEAWDFCQYRDEVIATATAKAAGDGGDPPQRWTLGSSTAFADLAGSPPNARFCAVVGDFLVLAYTYDATNGIQPQRVQWSALGDITSWTPSAATQSDAQILNNDGGPIMRIIGGDVCWIFQRNCIVAMTQVGPPLIFAFRVVHKNVGIVRSRAIKKVGNTIYFLSTHGFMAMDAQTGQMADVGAGKVNNWRLAQSGFTSESNGFYGRFDTIAYMIGQDRTLLLYNINSGRWTTYDASVYDGSAPLFTWLIESTNDAGQYLGFIASDKHFYAWPDGLWSSWTTANARIETAEHQLLPGRRAIVNRARIMQSVGTAGTETLSVKTRNSQTEAFTTTALSAATRGDDFLGRVNGRYHTFLMETTAKDTELQGIDIVQAVDGGAY